MFLGRLKIFRGGREKISAGGPNRAPHIGVKPTPSALKPESSPSAIKVSPINFYSPVKGSPPSNSIHEKLLNFKKYTSESEEGKIRIRTRVALERQRNPTKTYQEIIDKL